MAERIEQEEQANETIVLADRRRANRREYSDPVLISLMRKNPAVQVEPASSQVQVADEPTGVHRLAAARGIFLAVLGGSAIWLALLIGLWWVWVS